MGFFGHQSFLENQKSNWANLGFCLITKSNKDKYLLSELTEITPW